MVLLQRVEAGRGYLLKGGYAYGDGILSAFWHPHRLDPFFSSPSSRLLPKPIPLRAR
uniref:Uncharacterized protein n=1 Tax=Peronospora matthiolae TaxID=2874970 RepID=A0AAV1TEM0_9STRA